MPIPRRNVSRSSSIRSMTWSMKTQDGRVFGPAGQPSTSRAGGKSPVFVPSPLVLSATQEEDITSRVMKITVIQKPEKLMEIKLQIENEDLAYFDMPAFTKGEKFDFSFGYPGDLSEIFQMQIVGIKGFTVVTLECVVVENSFNWVQKTSKFEGVKRDLVVKRVGLANAFKKFDISPVRFDDFGPFQQINETDRQFLARLGKKYGYEIWTSLQQGVQTLHWGKRNNSMLPVGSATWRGGAGFLKKLEITENSIIGRPQGVTAVSYNPTTGKNVSAQVTMANAESLASLSDMSEISQKWEMDGETGQIVSLGPKNLGLSRLLFTGAPEIQIVNKGAAKYTKSSSVLLTSALSDAEASGDANAQFRKVQEEQLKIKATLIGNPKLMMGQIFEIKGVPQMIGGEFSITGTTHTLSKSGFVTVLVLEREGVNKVGEDKLAGFGKKLKKNKKLETGLVPVQYLDPESRFLARVQIPESDPLVGALNRLAAAGQALRR